MKNYLFLILFFSVAIQSFAQNNEETSKTTTEETKKKNFSISPSVFITSQHMWRGGSSGTAPCIEPNVTWAYKNLSLDTWASYAVNNSYKEIDLILTYNWRFISFSVADFYCPSPNTNVKFSNFKTKETEHLFEFKTNITFSEKVPIKLSGAIIFAGNDWEQKTDEIKQFYSTYIEVSYPFHLANIPISLELGMTPAKGMYAKDMKVFNYGLTVFKDIKINKHFSIPTSYKLVYNLERDLLYFSMGLIIQ